MMVGIICVRHKRCIMYLALCLRELAVSFLAAVYELSLQAGNTNPGFPDLLLELSDRSRILLAITLLPTWQSAVYLARSVSASPGQSRRRPRCCMPGRIPANCNRSCLAMHLPRCSGQHNSQLKKVSSRRCCRFLVHDYILTRCRKLCNVDGDGRYSGRPHFIQVFFTGLSLPR
jgi:hypothetical protein